MSDRYCASLPCVSFLLLSRLACVVHSLMSQSLTVLAVIDRDVTVFVQGRLSVALGWDLLMSYDSLILLHSFNSFLHSLDLSAIQVVQVVFLRCLDSNSWFSLSP